MESSGSKASELGEPRPVGVQYARRQGIRQDVLAYVGQGRRESGIAVGVDRRDGMLMKATWL